MEDLVEGDQAVEATDHGVDLGEVGTLFNLEEYDVLDDGLRGGHLDGGFGRRGLRVGFEGK